MAQNYQQKKKEETKKAREGREGSAPTPYPLPPTPYPLPPTPYHSRISVTQVFPYNYFLGHTIIYFR